MNRPCKSAIACLLFPGEQDPPVPNYSAEAADPLVWISISYPPFNPYRPPTLGGGGSGLFVATDCYGVSYSATSQTNANLLARLAAAICKEPSSQQYTNDPQTAHCDCPGGSVFSITVPAGSIAVAADPDPEAWLAAANAAALAYAQQQVSLIEEKSCVVTTNLTPRPGWICLGEELDPDLNVYTITGLNAAGDWLFSISGGALPAGVTLDKTGHNTAEIGGIPTVPGVYTYTIHAYRPVSPYQTVSVADTLSVFGLTNPALPDATSGTAYSQQLVSAGGTAPVTFALHSGSTIPTGLTLHPDGTIDGTPTVPGLDSFSVDITDVSGGVCTQAVTITVAAASGCITPTVLPHSIYGDTSYYFPLVPVVPIISPDADWTVVAGSVPPGMLLDEPTGIVYVPFGSSVTACGVFNFTVHLTASDPPTDCTQALSLTVDPIANFDCGGFPTTAPAGGAWVWAGGGSAPGGTVIYSFTICNNTCVAKNLNFHFTSGPWSGIGAQMSLNIVDNGFLTGGGILWSSPGPPNIQDVSGPMGIPPYSTHTIEIRLQTDAGPVNANAGGLSFSF